MLINFRFADIDCIIFCVKSNDYHIFCFQFQLSDTSNHSTTYANKGLLQSSHLIAQSFIS